MEFADEGLRSGPETLANQTAENLPRSRGEDWPPAESRQAEGPALEDQVEDPDDDQKPDKEDDADDPAQDAQHGCPPVATAGITNTPRVGFTGEGNKAPAPRTPPSKAGIAPPARMFGRRGTRLGREGASRSPRRPLRPGWRPQQPCPIPGRGPARQQPPWSRSRGEASSSEAAAGDLQDPAEIRRASLFSAAFRRRGKSRLLGSPLSRRKAEGVTYGPN